EDGSSELLSENSASQTCFAWLPKGKVTGRSLGKSAWTTKPLLHGCDEALGKLCRRCGKAISGNSAHADDGPARKEGEQCAMDEHAQYPKIKVLRAQAKAHTQGSGSTSDTSRRLSEHKQYPDSRLRAD